MIDAAAVYRYDLLPFVERTFRQLNPRKKFHAGPHIDMMCEYLMACYRREIKRLIINIPPRNLKSITASVAFPAWALGKDPSLRFMVGSYAAPLSIKHNTDCREVMRAPWYRNAFPGTVIKDGQDQKTYYETTENGSRRAVSVGSGSTGFGGDFQIVDDPHNANDARSDTIREGQVEWFKSQFINRRDDTDSVLIIIMQRLHERDLTGQLIAEEIGYEHLCLRAIHDEPERTYSFGDVSFTRKPGDVLNPDYQPADYLEILKRELGSVTFAGQYQQRPAPAEGSTFRLAWFPRYREAPAPGEVLKIVQSWDTAQKPGGDNDWSVCTTWAVTKNAYHLLSLERMRLAYPELKRMIINQAAKWSPHVILIEDASSGASLLQDLKAATTLPVKAVQALRDKETRAISCSALCESGRVVLPEKAAWLADFESELMHFPNGAHDDQVDSMTQFLNWIRESKQSEPKIRRL